MDEPPSGTASTRSIAEGGSTSGSGAVDLMPAPTMRCPSNSTSVEEPPPEPGRFRRFTRLMFTWTLLLPTTEGVELNSVSCGMFDSTCGVVSAPVAATSAASRLTGCTEDGARPRNERACNDDFLEFSALRARVAVLRERRPSKEHRHDARARQSRSELRLHNSPIFGIQERSDLSCDRSGTTSSCPRPRHA